MKDKDRMIIIHNAISEIINIASSDKPQKDKMEEINKKFIIKPRIK
jgi:hypothetical protein